MDNILDDLVRRFSHRKLIVSGNVFELIEYDGLPRKILTDEEKERKKARREAEGYVSDRPSLEESVKRSKTRLSRIVSSNAWAWKDERDIVIPSRFVTYTFRDHVTDVREASYEFTKSTQRMNYELYGKQAVLQYAAVPQYTKIGRVHFHAMYFNMAYMDRVYDFLAERWGQGFINFKTISETENVARYIVRYMAKDAEDERLRNHKRYYASRGLKMPLVLRHDVLIDAILAALPFEAMQGTPTIRNLDFVGDIRYSRYELPQKQFLESLPLDMGTREEIQLLQTRFPKP